MAAFKPSAVFSVAMKLLIPAYSSSLGVVKKTFPANDDGLLFFGSFKSYGGTMRTEKDINGIYEIDDTANVETYYRPDIKSDCRIYVPTTGAVYDVYGEPENIEMRNQYMKFRVRRVKGGV